jgi:hypothetical protein
MESMKNLDVLLQSGLYLNDLCMHDSGRELIVIGSQQTSDLKIVLYQEQSKNKQLEDSIKLFDAEVKKADDLLYRLLPNNIADR